MSHRRAPSTKLGALALFLLQLVLVGAAPQADVRLEAESADAPVHLESEASSACGLGHDHLFCSLCRALDLRATPAVATAGLEDVALPQPAPAVRAAGLPAGLFPASSRSPRAPPRV